MLRKIIPILFVFVSVSIFAQTTVTISSDKTYITEDESLNITATLNAVSASDVTVNFTFAGTADNVLDYTTMAGPFTVAGSSDAIAGATAGLLDAPYGLYLDDSGNIYIADQANHRVQKWAPDATEGTTVAGGNGLGSNANQLSSPSDVFVDASGNIYIADTDNNRVQKWSADGLTIETVAGGNAVGGSGNSELNSPEGVFVDASGNIYIADTDNNRVQKWSADGLTIETVAGGNGTGSALNQLSNPIGIFVDVSGNLFIADAGNHRVQEWASGATEGITVAGVSGTYGEDSSHLKFPFDVYVDALGSIYIADAGNHRVQKWLSGATEGSTVAGGNGQGASYNQFDIPAGIFVDSAEKIYVADKNNNRVQQNQFSPSIIIDAGQISASLEVAGVSDAISEGDETIIVDVTSVTNATLVEPSQQNLYIVCTAVPTGEQTQTFCNSALVSDLLAIGDNIQWYAAASGGSALSSTLSLVDGSSYFATQTVGACESLERFEVAVVINTPSAPTGDASQSFIDSATVADLEATGTDIQWYAASSGGSALGSATALVDGTSYFATQTLSGCESASRLEVVVTIIPYTTNTWTGAADNDWGNSANWSSAVVPDASHNVEIPVGSFPEYSGSGSCHNLTIAAGGGLTLSGTITAGGSVIIESDGTNSGSLIFVGSGALENTAKSSLATASITYERYIVQDNWYMLGSPLIGQTIDNDFITNNSIIGMKDYVEGPSEAWSTDYVGAAPGDNFSLGKGYAIKNSVSGVISLTGTPNSATKSIALTRSSYGWNLLSNPFTSAIAANNLADASNNLLTINEAVLDASYVGLYIWDQSTASYEVLNHSGGTVGQDYLQVGQGFFVKSSDPAGTFSMTPAMQSHQPNVAFKLSKDNSWANIILSLETNDAIVSTQISYHETMTKGLDIGYDAGLFNSNSEFSLYSRLIEDNGVDFALQCLPPDYENLIIPVGLNAKAGDIISFSVSATNIPEEYALILEDKNLNEFIDLSDENERYSIQLSSDLDGFGRFFLHTMFKDALGLDGLDTELNYQVFSRADLNQIVIRGEFSSNAVARIFSISGKIIAIVNLSPEVESSVSFDEETGVYIIQISDVEKTITRKISWVKSVRL